MRREEEDREEEGTRGRKISRRGNSAFNCFACFRVLPFVRPPPRSPGPGLDLGLSPGVLLLRGPGPCAPLFLAPGCSQRLFMKLNPGSGGPRACVTNPEGVSRGVRGGTRGPASVLGLAPADSGEARERASPRPRSARPASPSPQRRRGSVQSGRVLLFSRFCATLYHTRPCSGMRVFRARPHRARLPGSPLELPLASLTRDRSRRDPQTHALRETRPRPARAQHHGKEGSKRKPRPSWEGPSGCSAENHRPVLRTLQISLSDTWI